MPRRGSASLGNNTVQLVRSHLPETFPHSLDHFGTGVEGVGAGSLHGFVLFRRNQAPQLIAALFPTAVIAVELESLLKTGITEAAVPGQYPLFSRRGRSVAGLQILGNADRFDIGFPAFYRSGGDGVLVSEDLIRHV